ncbi:MAG: ChbG/HpnK family deacetylase [Desulfobacterales bacterium]|nr:ChbG/HpnK family deacetylase [Desulfobacterales bacterium]
MLYVNADDFGCASEVTDRILSCYRKSRIHVASAMTFMKDSERASDLARQNGLSVGLHLNLIQDFTDTTVPEKLRDQHRLVADYLKARKMNQILYNPLLRRAFGYVFHAQWEEFHRLYGKNPTRLDGHHHMHLCMNMLASDRLPKGIKIRRNFTFGPAEKDPLNRFYRYLVDCWLKSRFLCTDSFFSMAPINQGRLKRLVLISKSSDVEIMVHPGVKEEYLYLLSSEWASLISASSLLSHW